MRRRAGALTVTDRQRAVSLHKVRPVPTLCRVRPPGPRPGTGQEDGERRVSN